MAINIDRPGRYPYHALTNDDATLPVVSEGVGYVPATIADPDVANALSKSTGYWLQYNDLHKFGVLDLLSRSTPAISISGGELTYPLAAGLINLAPTETPVFFYLGQRIAFDDTALSIGGANPITFAASSRTWIYGTPPVAAGEYPAIRIENVALATAAAPIGDELVLGGVDTDGSHVTANLPTTHTDELPFGYPISLSVLTRTALSVTGNSAEPAVLLTNNHASGVALQIVGDALADLITSERVVVSGNVGGVGLTVNSAVGVSSALITGNGFNSNAQAALRIVGGAGVGLYMTGTGAGRAFQLDYTGTGVGMYLTATNADNESPVLAVLGNSLDATSPAIAGIAQSIGANGIEGITATAGGLTAYGLLGEGGATSGSGVKGYAPNGYGVVAESDTTTPARAALRIVPQDADASSSASGDMLFNSARNVLRLRTAGSFHSLHQSQKGWVKGWSDAESGGPGNSGAICLTQVFTEESGGYLCLTATGSVECSPATANFTVGIYRYVDGGAGDVLIASQIEAVDGTGAGPTNRSFVIRAKYTQASTSHEDYAVKLIQNAGTILWDNVILSVEGVL